VDCTLSGSKEAINPESLAKNLDFFFHFALLIFLRFFTAKQPVFIQNYPILKDNIHGAKSLLFVPLYTFLFYPVYPIEKHKHEIGGVENEITIKTENFRYKEIQSETEVWFDTSTMKNEKGEKKDEAKKIQKHTCFPACHVHDLWYAGEHRFCTGKCR